MSHFPLAHKQSLLFSQCISPPLWFCIYFIKPHYYLLFQCFSSSHSLSLSHLSDLLTLCASPLSLHVCLCACVSTNKRNDICTCGKRLYCRCITQLVGQTILNSTNIHYSTVCLYDMSESVKLTIYTAGNQITVSKNRHQTINGFHSISGYFFS